MTAQREEDARPLRLARSAAANLEFVAIVGIVLLSFAAVAGLVVGIGVAALGSGADHHWVGGVLIGASLIGWPLSTLPCFAGLALARYLRLRADSEPVG